MHPELKRLLYRIDDRCACRCLSMCSDDFVLVPTGLLYVVSIGKADELVQLNVVLICVCISLIRFH